MVNDILHAVLAKELNGARTVPGRHRKVTGLNLVDKVVGVDQSPIGRTPRSNPATYTGVFDHMRKLFAETTEAKVRGYQPGRFSFNVKGGRCEACHGDGTIKIEMNFLPDVYVPCEVCHGARYNRETLEVHFKGKSIAEVLDMPIEEAADFFEAVPAIARHLRTLNDVGLGYVRLGQPAPTLSGGEAQRVKLASELQKRSTGRTIYILDEPTTGLHFEDVRKLLGVLGRLVDAGNSVLVIEHNLDVIKTADWIIDMGPEGGTGGGTVVAEGTPEQVAKIEASHTGRFLREVLKGRGTVTAVKRRRPQGRTAKKAPLAPPSPRSRRLPPRSKRCPARHAGRPKRRQPRQLPYGAGRLLRRADARRLARWCMLRTPRSPASQPRAGALVVGVVTVTSPNTYSIPQSRDEWAAALGRPGVVLLPLRLFLGLTFTFAGLQKLADPHFFDASRPTSIQGQLALFKATSPISFLLGPISHHAVAFGVLTAIAELGVGIGTLLGLWSRAAALVGAALSFSFFLTVSWKTRPYYYGSDIVFTFMWIPFILVGSAGFLSLDAWRRRPSTPPAERGERHRSDRGAAAVQPPCHRRLRRRCCGWSRPRRHRRGSRPGLRS